MNVLIVDDEVLNRKLLADVLRENGHEVTVATNGQEGLEEALRNPPHLILLDLKMPVMDGYETLERLKADPKTEPIPVWIVTSSAMPEEIEKIRQGDVAECFTKPIDIVALVEQVNLLDKERD